MQKKKGFIRSWVFIGLIILVIFSLSGVGLVWAYKNKKLTQAQKNNSSSEAVNLSELDPQMPTKVVYGTEQDGDLTKIRPGELINIDLTIPGMKDASSQVLPAEVMLVIDMSQSMDNNGEGSGCRFSGIDHIAYSRLCYAKRAAIIFIEQAAAKSTPIRIGYQMFSTYDKTYNNDFFRGLKDIRDDNVRLNLENDLIGKPGEENQFGYGTAMGMGISKAVRELATNGNPNANKYIIVLGDGDENIFPSTSGCKLGSWPYHWPPNGSECGYHLTGLNSYLEIADRLDNRLHPNVRTITLDMVTSWQKPVMQAICDAESPRRSPCALSPQEIRTNTSPHEQKCPGWQRPGDPINPYCTFQVLLPWYPGSPADEAKENNVKVFTVGYYGRGKNKKGSNKNPALLQKIAAELFAPVEPGESFSPGYFSGKSDDLTRIFEGILRIIDNQNTGAPFTMVETLPLGASVAIGDISISRGGTNLNLTPTLGYDGQERRTITFDTSSLPNFGYASSDPDNQSFEVKIHNISSDGIPSSACFDPDQDWDCGGNRISDDPKTQASNIKYSFPKSGLDDKYVDMPQQCLCFESTQYTGDIYGTSISNYAFPGIDVTVAGGGNSSTEAVWSLENYNFSENSFSSYDGFKDQMDKVKIELMKRSKNLPANDFSKIFRENPNPDIYPDGQVYHTTGNVTISNPFSSINQRATAIIDGNLTISAGQIKKIKESNNVLLLVFGDVRITGDVSELDLGIVAPDGVITIDEASANLKIKGFLIAKQVQLRVRNVRSQSINYDSNFTLYPPPGLSSMLLPIFKEVKP